MGKYITKFTGILLAALILFVLPETTMASFFSKTLDAQEFAKLLHDLPGGKTSDREISSVTLKNQALPLEPLENIHFKSCKWDSVDSYERTFKNVIFEDCEFNNINMRNAKLINVQFIQSELTNVVMNNSHLEQVKFQKSKLISADPNIDNSYNGIQADEILFDDCDLTGVGFYRAKAIFRFEKSRLADVNGQSLSVGSALYFHNTQGSLVNFDRSNLNTIEVIDSKIGNRSSVGGGNVKSVLVENSELDFVISDNSDVDSIVYRNSGNVITGGGKNNKTISIKDCPKGTRVINTGSDGFDLLEIENCHVPDLTFFDSVGETVSIKNSSFYEMDFRDSNIKHLILENVKIESSLEYSDTSVGQLETKNVTMVKGMEIYKDGANFEIKPDHLIEE